MSELSPTVAAEARRILDAAARRLLAEKLTAQTNGEAIRSASGRNSRLVDDRPD